jgi:hypothetical protein
MQARGRSEEVGVPLDYLRQLEALHDEWLLDNPRAVVLDGMKQWSAAEILSIIEQHSGRATRN